MKQIVYGLITEAFGHGLASLNFTKAERLIPVAYSDKESKEDFEAHVEQIYNNMIFFAPTLQKATWEEREKYALAGWNIRKDLLEGKITREMWNRFAATSLLPVKVEENLPNFASLEAGAFLFVPQKLQSDVQCGVTALEQSVPLKAFEFLKKVDCSLVLGQHFHKVNDLKDIAKLVYNFGCYVPGLIEDEEIFGIRGVQHKNYWNMYAKLDGAVGIAGTHTWFLLTCFPDTPQIILFNQNGVENWKHIEAAYQEAGKHIVCVGFKEGTNLAELSKEIEAEFNDLL